MRKPWLKALVLAALVVPCAGAWAAEGGRPDVPPGLLNARARHERNYQRKMQKLQLRHDEELAELEEALAAALAVGDLELAAEIEQAIADENAEFAEKMAKLQQKLADKLAHFDGLIAKYQANHAEEPPEEGEESGETEV